MKNTIFKSSFVLLFTFISITIVGQVKINNAFPIPKIDGSDAIISGKIDKTLMQKVKELKLKFYICSPIVGSMEYMLTIDK